MQELLDDRDYLGHLMITLRDNPDEREELYNEVRDIEEILYFSYGVYPVFTGFGWRPWNEPRAYRRQPRVPVRRPYHPSLSPIPEDEEVRLRSASSGRSSRSRRSRRSQKMSKKSRRSR
jgi:hypothetical protein